MKKTAILINVARGPVVDEQALYDALTTGEIAAAGLDVLNKEPIAADNPLAQIKGQHEAVHYTTYGMGAAMKPEHAARRKYISEH